jgi:hypothetical protein
VGSADPEVRAALADLAADMVDTTHTMDARIADLATGIARGGLDA